MSAGCMWSDTSDGHTWMSAFHDIQDRVKDTQHAGQPTIINQYREPIQSLLHMKRQQTILRHHIMLCPPPSIRRAKVAPLCTC